LMCAGDPSQTTENERTAMKYRIFDSEFFSMKRCAWAASLTAVCALVTGCPHNDYTVELKPVPGGVERTLVFYRADGTDSNGIPDYRDFPSNELAAITAVYPDEAVKPDGQRYIARGEFNGALPGDVGGAGSCTNFVTSLGEAGIYLERFRGQDDLAALTAKRLRAADQLDDLIIGWTRTEFGRERGYKKLQIFLDRDFRDDLKSGSLYLWAGGITSLSQTNAPDEFIARFSQYLLERNYLKLSDTTALGSICGNDMDALIPQLLRRLVMEKLGIPVTEPLPQCMAVLADAPAFEKSWEHYLAGTDLYRSQVKKWEAGQRTNPKLEKPKALNATDDLWADLLAGSGFMSNPDHLTVKLKLPHPPSHTNGKWQDGQVVWTADLPEDRPLPAFCYASWSEAAAAFQIEHLGAVLLVGDPLSQYCFWENGLDAAQATEWESFLDNLQPGAELKTQLKAFRFSAEAASAEGSDISNQPAIGPQLLVDALGK
jgi:hypothetical protein